MRKLLMLALAGIGLLAMGPAAQAVPITGEIDFVGSWAPSGGSSAGTATGIDFVGSQIIESVSGSYSGLVGTGAFFNDFTFAPFSSPVSLWSVTSGSVYSFTLTNLAVALQIPTALVLTGTGFLSATGFDDTPAEWTFSATGGQVQFSFASNNLAVPEPASLGLMALGLSGLAAAGSKRARRPS